MNEEAASKERSWLEKLSDVLLTEPKDKDQLIKILRDAETHHLLDTEALTMIEGVLQVSEMQARDIMVPRSQMIVIEVEKTPKEFLPQVIDSAHSRFPVIGEDRDEVVGILLAKDLLSYLYKGEENKFNLKDLLRPAIFVPESKRLNVLLKEFRLKRNHMAIVVDEYGGVAGVVTIEDVLEQIVGEIEDEFDIDEESFIKRLDDTTFIVKALTPIDEFNEQFQTDLSDEEFDTIGGIVMHEFGKLPKRGETVEIGNLTIEILHADNRRIRLVQVTKSIES